ncbi:hypothetical protein GVX82_02185 [Patescibacteria group bacterium]|nr:hypothetical protein [Patescibacteria group bacterium]
MVAEVSAVAGDSLDGRRIFRADRASAIGTALQRAEREAAGSGRYDRAEAIVAIGPGTHALDTTFALDRSVNVHIVGAGAERTTLRGAGTFVNAHGGGVALYGVTMRDWSEVFGGFTTSDTSDTSFDRSTYWAPHWSAYHSRFIDVTSLVDFTKAGVIRGTRAPVRIKPDGVDHLEFAHTRHISGGASDQRGYLYMMGAYERTVVRDSEFTDMWAGIIYLGQNYGFLRAGDQNFFIDQWGPAHISGTRFADPRGSQPNMHPVATNYNVGLVLRGNEFTGHRTGADDAETIYVKSKLYIVDNNRVLDGPGRGVGHDGAASLKFGHGYLTNNTIAHGSDGSAAYGVYVSSGLIEATGNDVSGFNTCVVFTSSTGFPRTLGKLPDGAYEYHYGAAFAARAREPLSEPVVLHDEVYACQNGIRKNNDEERLLVRDSDLSGSGRAAFGSAVDQIEFERVAR